jgi:hypothetical protein
MSDDRAREIGAVAAESGDAAVGSRANEPCDDGDETVFEEGKKNAAAAFFGFFQMRLGVAESVASEHEIGRGNGNSGDAGFLECSGEETSTESFAEGRKTIGELGGGVDAALPRNFVEKVAVEELEDAPDAVFLVFRELEIVKHIEVEMNDAFGFRASMRKFAFGEKARDGEKPVGDALHRGDNDDYVCGLCSSANEAGGMQHALGAKQGGAAKFQCHNGIAMGFRVAAVRDTNVINFIAGRKAFYFTRDR